MSYLIIRTSSTLVAYDPVCKLGLIHSRRPREIEVWTAVEPVRVNRVQVFAWEYATLIRCNIARLTSKGWETIYVITLDMCNNRLFEGV